MQVSIIVPAYNSANHLSQCIDSLLGQTSADFEVLLINDGSTDATGSICNSYADKDARIRVFHQSNSGLSEARNVGLKEAVGEYVLFVDSDDWITGDTCHLMYQKAKETNADITLGTMSYWNSDNTSYKVGEKSEMFVEEIVMNGGACLRKMLKTGYYTPMVCGNLYRKQFLETFHLHFTGKVHEDERFSPIAFYYARGVTYVPGDFYFYRQHEDSIMHSYQLKERMQALADISLSLSTFATTRIQKEEIHQDVLCSLLWQSGALYLRALKLNKRILRNGEEYLLSGWDISNIHLCKDLVTEENKEWLDDIEIMLEDKQKQINFIKQCNNDKKQLFIFSRESIGSKYGVGTYIHQLIQCFDLKEWMVCVVSLHVNEQDYSLEEKDGIYYFAIPYPVFFFQ